MKENFYIKVMEASRNIDSLNGFENTEYPFPIFYALKGKSKPSLEEIRASKKNLAHSDAAGSDLLWLAELIETENIGKTKFFVGDDALRDFSLSLNNSPGWAFLLGKVEDKTQLFSLIETLIANRWAAWGNKIFVGGDATKTLTESKYAKNVFSFGFSEQSTVYFAQMLVRHALIYGRVSPGDQHALSHFIEDYTPGVIFVLGELTEIEKSLVQELLTLGVPAATVKKDFGLTGKVKVAKTPRGMVTYTSKLSNIRKKYDAGFYQKMKIKLPIPVHWSYAAEKLQEEDIYIRLEDPLSFLLIKPGKGIKKDCVEAVGKLSLSEKGSYPFSVLIELGNKKIDKAMTQYLESLVPSAINEAEGLKSRIDSQSVFSIHIAKKAIDNGFKIEHLGKLVLAGLRHQAPAIGPMKVTLILKRKIIERLHSEVEEYRLERKEEIMKATEENVPVFYSCIRCRASSLAHACIITPERPAICGWGGWLRAKTRAIVEPNSRYRIIEKGECLDPMRGEYSGVNKSVAELTEGRVNRIFLHSIFDYPHTCCSCFLSLAFYIPEVDGIGIMSRGFKGTAPNGMTWTKLANMAAGRQTPGIAGFSPDYLRSSKFLQADGCFKRVVWMNSILKKKVEDILPMSLRDRIATEKDVQTMEELKKFLKGTQLDA